MGLLRLPEDLTPPGLFGDLDVHDAVSPGRQKGRKKEEGKQHQGRQKGREEGRQGGRRKPKPVKPKPEEAEAVSGVSSFRHRPTLFNWGALSGSWRTPAVKQMKMVYDGELNNVHTDTKPA